MLKNRRARHKYSRLHYWKARPRLRWVASMKSPCRCQKQPLALAAMWPASH